LIEAEVDLHVSIGVVWLIFPPLRMDHSNVFVTWQNG